MKRMDWLDDKKDEISILYNEGETQAEISKHFNVSQTAISIRLRKWGLSNPDGNRFKRFDEIDEETVKRMYWDEEMHPVQIAEKYGCDKQVIVNRMKDWGIPLRTKSQARIGRLNPIFGVGHTKGSKKKMSEAFENGRTIGFNTNWGVGNFYKTPNQGDVWMRSGWEIATADYLTAQNKNWYYEYEWIKLSESFRYLPDFYLPEYNLYIEVKGRVKEKDLRIKDIMIDSGHKFLFWDGEELLKRGIIRNPGRTDIYNKYVNSPEFIDNWESYK
jgi:hypothetical protein